MEELLARRRPSFTLLAAAVTAICIAVIALPDTLLGQLQRNRPLSDAQAGWAYRLIAGVAILQLLYGGFSIFRIERVEAARARGDEFAWLRPEQVVASLARTGAGMAFLTVFYGLATVAITGVRGGFWLFPLLAAAQAAWYYREIGQIARWEAVQPLHAEVDRDHGAWSPPGPGLVPPLALGMRPRAKPE